MSRAIAATLRSRPGSLADLEALGDDVRAELIDGVLYELPMTSLEHGRIATVIVAALLPAYQFGRGGPGGWQLQTENGFLVARSYGFQPDAVAWRASRLRKADHTGRPTVVPDWVLEVLSKSTRHHDLTTKRDAYARVGVRHRWYVDPDARVLQTFELRRGSWIETGVFTEDDVVRAAPFETVALPMADWWWRPPSRRETAAKPTRARRRA